MTVPYQKVLAEVGLRINAIYGPISTTLETNYAKATQSASDYVSAIFPKTSIQDAIINAEENLVAAVSTTGGHPYRAYISSYTAALASGAVVPSTDASSVPVVGVYGSVV